MVNIMAIYGTKNCMLNSKFKYNDSLLYIFPELGYIIIGKPYWNLICQFFFKYYNL